MRSGQQFYAPDGDLIVLGAVSAGADVIADGNIPCLRAAGSAPGLDRDAGTRIFCHSLEAALISIAGRCRSANMSAWLTGAGQHKFG